MQHMFKTALAILAVHMVSPDVLAQDQRSPIGVMAATVSKEPFYDRIEAIGTLRANESVDITATVTETISAIHFEDNARVKKDAVLVEMTNDEEQALLSEAESTFVEAEKQYNRIKNLAARNNASQSQLDERKRLLETAKARLVATKSRLQDRLVIAPFDGVVGLRNVSVGALVTPGDVIITLDDDSQMKLDFPVPAVYLEDIKVGLPVRAQARAYQGKDFSGTISSIDSRIDPVTRSFQVRAIVPNDNKLLKPGMLMKVFIKANQHQALMIPESALVPDGDKQFVFTLDKKEQPTDETTPVYIAKKTEVSIGGRRPGNVEITDGLKEGERVITDGTVKIRDGVEVTLQKKPF